MHKIRKDDMVKIIAGKDKDKTGKVLDVDTKKNTVLVEGCKHGDKAHQTEPDKPDRRYRSSGSCH